MCIMASKSHANQKRMKKWEKATARTIKLQNLKLKVSRT